MANVTMIPARRLVGNTGRQENKPKLRVAAYCKVSTDSDEQATSYEAQVEHYTNYIQANPEWEFASIFADDGISGTNTKYRDGFNNMIDECEAGNVDMIITKSISRFARNTLDCLKYIRQLKEKNIPVFFEKESINTMDAKSEVLLTIMASLARQESQSLSQNVKMGLQFRYQNGQVQVNYNRFLGYTKDENGKLIIDPEQAEVVKRIYREYLDGYSMDKIKAGLERDGILTGAGKTTWHTSTINKILRNEKYIGDALLQKTYTTDFLSKTRVKNNGLVPQYYVEGDHEAIIPKEIFLRVQEELVRRRRVTVGNNGRKARYSCSHYFSQLIVCGECGEIFRRVHWNNNGCKSIVWRCSSRLEGIKECHARTVNELVLQQIVLKAINEMAHNKTTYIKQLQQNITDVIKSSSDTATAEIDAKLDKLQKELLKKANRKDSYDEIAEEILRLRDERNQIAVDTSVRDEQIARIKEIQDFIKDQRTDITEFDEAIIRRWIKQITVYDDSFTIEFKSGLIIDIDE
ncbi:MAG: recombinase family protein [Eggerthia catenaformis]|uniref:recombinase family protein n=1 Tax=Eggerthia catenaformis TaxID=31973 RepID=UPI003FA1871B